MDEDFQESYKIIKKELGKRRYKTYMRESIFQKR